MYAAMNLDITTTDEYVSNAGFVLEKDSISELWEANGGDAALEQHDADSDVMWSLASNSFFVSGGLCSVIGCSWDMHGQPDEASARSTWMVYNALWVLGSLVYLFNSIIDVLWALRVKKRQKQRRMQRQYRLSLKEKLANSPKEDQSRTRKLLKKLKPKNMWKRARKHVAHRRDMSAAISFGFAAAFGTISALLSLSADAETSAGVSEALSIHLYCISAGFAICGRRPKPKAGWATQFSGLEPWWMSFCARCISTTALCIGLSYRPAFGFPMPCSISDRISVLYIPKL
jgi:hypothetical protein